MTIRCDDCKDAMIEVERAGQEMHTTIWCDNPIHQLPEMVVDGLDNYLDELPNNWQPDSCPLEEIE